MDRFWDRLFIESPLAATFTKERLPSVDISKTEDEFLIKADPNIGGTAKKG